LEVLREIVGVVPTDDNRALGQSGPRRTGRGGLFGGQMVAQCLSACAHTLPSGSLPDSLHVNLLAGGQADVPVEFSIERVRDGRAMQHREVRGYQGDDLIVQATVVSVIPARGLDWQLASSPTVGPPDESPDAADPWAAGLGQGIFQTAHPAGGLESPPPPHPLWIRANLDLPEDPWLHAAVRAFWSDFGMNFATRATYGTLDPEPVSSLSATHSVWFHRATPTHDWHLFDVHVNSIHGNQGFVQASLFDRTGALSASIFQGVFVRRPLPSSGPTSI
jgi:acyl-CoA thioesterase-2